MLSSNRGLVVEFSPATRETRVRFSAVAFLSVAAPTVPSRRPFSAVAFLPASVLPLRLRHLVVRSQRLHIFARLFFWLRGVFGTCVSSSRRSSRLTDDQVASSVALSVGQENAPLCVHFACVRPVQRCLACTSQNSLAPRGARTRDI